MTIVVPDDILRQADRCPKGHGCTKSGGGRPLCLVEEADGPSVLFLKAASFGPCPYRTNFAGKQVCLCPVHFEIFRKGPGT